MNPVSSSMAAPVLSVALLLGALPGVAQAQISTARAAPASAPAPHTPREVREEAVVPGDLRPENPVTPQIKVPIGRKPVEAAKTPEQAARGQKAAAAGGVDDEAARCLAQASEATRAACRERVKAGKPAANPPR